MTNPAIEAAARAYLEANRINPTTAPRGMGWFNQIEAAVAAFLREYVPSEMVIFQMHEDRGLSTVLATIADELAATP